MHIAALWKVRRKGIPLAPRFQNIQYRTENIVEVDGSWFCGLSDRHKYRLYFFKLFPRNIAGVGFAHNALCLQGWYAFIVSGKDCG